MENGVVSQLQISFDNLTDISPVRALGGLKSLTGRSKGGDIKSLVDLSPSQGMPLVSLDLFGTKISDLSPLKGMKLDFLNCFGTPVSDLSPLRGMPLTQLHIGLQKSQTCHRLPG